MSDVCLNCGKSEDDHCEFVKSNMPEGCVCDPVAWGGCGGDTSICEAFTGEFEDCLICDHEKGCHKEETT